MDREREAAPGGGSKGSSGSVGQVGICHSRLRTTEAGTGSQRETTYTAIGSYPGIDMK